MLYQAPGIVTGELRIMPVEGPDFLCIGMMKAGTGWLFDQLQFHPDFWMPPVKELHYLDRDEGRGRNARDILRATGGAAARPKGKAQAAHRPWDERDLQFLREMKDHRKVPLDLARYANLFRFKGNLKSGDVTPHYGVLENDRIEEIAKHLPETKNILLIRNPVERAWSALSMQDRLGKFETGVLEDPTAFRDYLQRSKRFLALSLPVETARRWAKHAPKMETRIFFFDDIAERPDDVRRDILEFLGADPDKSSGTVEADYNRKSRARKLELTEDLKEILIEHFRDELQLCAVEFGGPAKKWAAGYGLPVS